MCCTLGFVLVFCGLFCLVRSFCCQMCLQHLSFYHFRGGELFSCALLWAILGLKCCCMMLNFSESLFPPHPCFWVWISCTDVFFPQEFLASSWFRYADPYPYSAILQSSAQPMPVCSHPRPLYIHWALWLWVWSRMQLCGQPLLRQAEWNRSSVSLSSQ